MRSAVVGKAGALCALSVAITFLCGWSDTNSEVRKVPASRSSPLSQSGSANSNLVVNPSVETSESAARPANWSSETWGANTTKFGYLTTGHTGKRSLKTEITARTSGDSRWRFADVAVSAGKTYEYTAWYQSTVETQIEAVVTTADGTRQYQHVGSCAAASGWAMASARYTVPANAVKVSIYQAIATVGSLVIDDVSLLPAASDGFNRPLVSLTFDDGWRSQYLNALPALERHRAPATFYPITGASLGADEYMTIDMIKDLASRGNEVGAHTLSHPHLPRLSAEETAAELAGGQANLRGWLGGRAGTNFASPYGEFDQPIIDACRGYYRSHRTVDEGVNAKSTFDPYQIKVRNILSGTTAEQVATWVESAIADRTWLVLVYHEVAEEPVDPTYATTPERLASHLNAIASLGVPVVTVDQALDEIQAQLDG